MTKITITMTDTGFVIENNNGRLELSWADFYDIARYCDSQDALNEVEDYLAGYDDDSCMESFGMTSDKIIGDADLLNNIVEKLIKIHINGETTDDIYDAIECVCK